MMFILKLMEQKNLTRIDLSRISGIPESTLRDILNGTSQIEHCEALTLMLMAEVLGTTVEEIVEHAILEDEEDDFQEDEPDELQNESAMVFYSFLEQLEGMKNLGSDLDFVVFNKSGNWVEDFFNDECHGIALFIVGMSDYVCRKHGIELIPEYEKYRNMRLKKPFYPLRLYDPDNDSDEYELEKERIRIHAVPELARMNIFMTEKDLRWKE